MNSLALAYKMKKKMAHGGKIGEDNPTINNAFYPGESGTYRGKSVQGNEVRGARMAREDKYILKDKEGTARKREGKAKEIAHETLKNMREMKKPELYAEGGFVNSCPDCAAGQCHKHSQTLTSGPGMKIDSETYMKNRGLSTKELEDDQKMAKGGEVEDHKTRTLRNYANSWSGSASQAKNDPYHKERQKEAHHEMKEYAKEKNIPNEKVKEIEGQHRGSRKHEDKEYRDEKYHASKIGMSAPDYYRSKIGHEDEADVADEMVSKIIKRKMSEGGLVSNSDHGLNESDTTDLKPNNFDYLSLNDDLWGNYSEESSGDQVGNDQLDKEDDDIVSRVMRSRRLGGKMPRPA